MILYQIKQVVSAIVLKTHIDRNPEFVYFLCKEGCLVSIGKQGHVVSICKEVCVISICKEVHIVGICKAVYFVRICEEDHVVSICKEGFVVRLCDKVNIHYLQEHIKSVNCQMYDLSIFNKQV